MIYLDSSIKTKNEKIELAIKLDSKNKTKQAIDILKSLQTKYPEDLMLIGLLGHLFRKNLDFNKALNNFNKILEKNKYHELAIVEKSVCLFELKKYDLCRKFLSQALKNKKIKSKEHFHIIFETMGLSLLQNNQYKRAEYYFKKVLEIYPKCTTSLGDLGFIASKQKKFDEAIEYFKKVLKIESSKRVLEDLGMIYVRLKKFDEAIEYFKKVLKIDEKNKEALHNLFLSYLELEDYKKANEISNRLIKKDDSGFYTTQKAEILFELKRYKEAIKYCNLAIKKNSKHLCPYLTKSESLIQLGNKKEAQKVVTDAIKNKFKRKKERDALLKTLNSKNG